MLSQEEARARVAKGAAHLDQVRPGWFNRIDVGTLTLHDPCGCIVGQLCGGDGERFYENMLSLGIPLPEETIGCGDQSPQRNLVTATLGFDLKYAEYGNYTNKRGRFQPLQDAWVDAIADRRLSQGTHEAPVTVGAVDPVGHWVTG